MSLKALNPQQRAAITHKTGPLLVVAGAGTGKTEVITRRIAHLIDSGRSKPSEILAVTFTEKAAREMETRVSDLLGKYVLDVNITTFNSFGHDLLRRFAYDIGLSPEVRLVNETQQALFLRDNLDALKLDYYAPVTNPEKFLADLAKYFSRLKSELLTPSQYTKFVQKLPPTTDKLERKRQQELAAAYTSYQKLMRRHNLVDFEDQLYLPVELLEKKPNIQKLLHHEIKWILVDEFQDTNPAQSRLIDLLAASPSHPPTGAGGANITVVGDDDQSIYHFRGAVVSNILQFRDRYPAAKVITLAQNYRSSQAILDSAYKLIQHNNPDRLEYQYALDKRLKGVVAGSPPLLQQFSQYEEEAAWIAAAIGKQIKKGKPPAQLAVLIRKNSQANLIVRNLEAQGVDYYLLGQEEDLYKQPTVKLLLQLLAVIVDPADSENLFHLLSSHLYQLPPVWLREQVSAAKRLHLPLETYLKNDLKKQPAKEAASLRQVLNQLAIWRGELSNLTVGQLCYRILDDTGELSSLVTRARQEPAQESQISDLRQFFNSLHQYEQIARDDTAIGYVASLPTLLGSGERLAVEDLPEVFGEKVKVMTVHKAKGLEFDTVYLFDMTQGTFPATRRGSTLEIPDGLLSAKRSTSGEEHIQEERRLCYVAMTRAKRNLIVSYSYDHGGKIAKKPSQFLGESFDISSQTPQLLGQRSGIQQIELFKAKKIEAALLPPSIWQGDQLLLTARQIEDYLMCPAEFYLRYVISPPQPPSVALEYGTIMHGMVQLYNQGRRDGRSVKLESLLAYIHDNWPPEGYLSNHHKQRALKQAETSLKRWYKREQSVPRHPRYIEKPFELEFKKLNLIVKGRMDAVYVEGERVDPVRIRSPQGGRSRAFGGADSNGVEIRDYKTGAPHVEDQDKADKRSKSSLQLGIYALAWQWLQGEIPKLLTLDFLDSGLVGNSSRTDRQLETVTSKIEHVAQRLRQLDFKPRGSHIFCSHKEFGF